MRQDAVMQQVFCSVNQWLRRDPATRRRNLLIRTYRCVPLGEQAGLGFLKKYFAILMILVHYFFLHIFF